MDEHVIKTYVRQEQVFVSGAGCTLEDAEGNLFLDFLGGIAVNALGHAHPGLTEALRDQLGKVVHLSNLFRHPYTETVAEKLAELSGLHAVFFCNSGAEANECALKLARKHHELQGRGERNDFIALEGGFHGRTMGALSVTSNAKYRDPFGPLIPGVTFINPGDEEALRKALEAKPAALILEPILGEGGIVDLPESFLKLARQLCTETGTILIHDEVQSGCGRTGTFLCAQQFDITPDIATLAKPLAAGLPMGAVLVKEELAEVLVPGDHGSTFAGGPLACRAALVLLNELQAGLLDNVQVRGAQLRAGLEALQAEFAQITEVRGRGLMQAIVLQSGAAELQRDLYARGLITNCTAGTVVRFLPAYVVTSSEVERALTLVQQSLSSLSTSRKEPQS